MTITEIRSHLYRTRLYRKQYIRFRRYTDTIRLRIQHTTEKTELQMKNHQPKITQYFQTHNLMTTPGIDRHSDVDLLEDYRGESD